jgi:hypothetical protein
MTSLDFGDHLLPSGSVEINPGVAVIGLCQVVTEKKINFFLRKGGERFSPCAALQFFLFYACFRFLIPSEY